MSTFLRNKTISKTTPLRKENPFPQFNVASHKRPRIRLSFEYTTTLLSGEGGEGRTGTATMFRKMLSKYTIFLTVLSKIVYKVIRVFSQEYLQGQNKNTLKKKHFTEAVLSTKFHARPSSHRKAPPHIRFSSTLFKKVRFRNSCTTRADCYIFSCTSGMEGSENVKSNLSFSEESEQDL